ncbi:MAG: NFACT family protein [Candidatus Zixiibacteriota bacterium]
MQTALHIRTVVAEARRELIDSEFYNTEFFRKARAGRLFFRKNKKKSALALLFHPLTHGALFLPAGKVDYDTPEKPFPFFQDHYGDSVVSIEQLEFDRIIKITLSGERGGSAIILEALGPSGNIWLLSESLQKVAALRKREFSISETYKLPGASTKLSIESLSAASLGAALSEHRNITITGALTKTLAGINETLANEIVHRARVSPSATVSDLSEPDRRVLVETIDSLVSLAGAAQSGYLYSGADPASAHPFKLRSVPEEPEKFPSYSLALLALGNSNQSSATVADEEQLIRQALKSACRKQRRMITRVEKEMSEYRNSERYRELADILKAHLPEIKKGGESVELPDLYGDGPVTIKLDPKLSGVENADAYYKRHRKGRDGLALTERRLEIARHELAQLEEISRAFEMDPDGARERYAGEISALLKKTPSSVQSASREPRTPYREYTISTGLKIIVGRDGTDNDDTTFKHVKPYELWFHASQCPGSHVGMKFPVKRFAPSQSEIAETAAIAAWFSRARNNASAPVNYTERRYVRKPRKAKPGLVTIERERTIMVVPKKPERESGK